MLRVPELKSGEQPFDPAFTQTMTPWQRHPHALNIGQKPWDTAKPDNTDPETKMTMILNLAVVKEELTAFHRDEDEAMRMLGAFSSSKICDITTEHENFLKTRLAAGENACKNEEQKTLFRSMTKTFVAQSRARALALRHRRTMEYWRKTVEEQNNAFLARALRPENVTDDQALATYRDLILYNMENMLAESPEKEKQTELNAAKTAFTQKVLEKRLEIDPHSALAMAEEAGARQLLGDEECDALAHRARSAVREGELLAAAQEWVAGEIPPKEAEEKAASTFSDEEERKYVLDRYRLHRFEENKTFFDAAVANIASAWERVREAGFAESAIPTWMIRNEPSLADCFRDCLRRRGDAGGEDAPDYPQCLAFLRKFTDHGLWKALEHLREEKNLHALLLASGGPASTLWLLLTRLLGGTAQREDTEYASALLLAWEEGKSQDFMVRFADELNRLEEKSPLKVLELARSVEESFPHTEEIDEE